MRCVSFCTAESYKLQAIIDTFKKKGYETHRYRKVLHLIDHKKKSNIFIFSHGCVVTWALKHSEEKKLIKELEPFATNILPHMERDCFIFCYGEKTEMKSHKRFNADIIVLDTNSAHLKLALSHGLAKSIQLESYETEVQKIIDKNSSFFVDLAKSGTTSLRRRGISKRLGEIFTARSKINLRSEYLEAPEYFWEHPSLEEYYTMSEKFLDMPRRITALNQKLNVLHELFEMLISQLQHRHSAFLETMIIALFLIDIILGLIEYFFLKNFSF